MRRYFLIGMILAAVGLVRVPSGAAADGTPYPDKGPIPTPMWGKTFRCQDPISGGLFNGDGTNSKNPVVDAGTQTLGGVTGTYLLKKLQTNDSIAFNSHNYTVYSAVLQKMTIDYAYKNASQPLLYYDPQAMGGLDFSIPDKINNGQPTDLLAAQPPNAPTTSDYTREKVYLTKPPTDPKSLFFIPNLPNTGGGHDGLTANVYFVNDPYVQADGYTPKGPTPHLTPYGWALDPKSVNAPYTVYLLDKTGGQLTGKGKEVKIPTPPMNIWKHTIQGNIDNLKKFLIDAVESDPEYPFPPGPDKASKLSWLRKGGIYLHVQPQPGFQRNLLRYYTAWGAADLYNQSSGLFVRPDGAIELPAVQVAGQWRYAPVVTQTWDGSQRYTLLNLTNAQVPSTYDDYPGLECYLASNVFLPGRAGVVTTYVDYLVQDKNGLSPREMDMWLGLKGATADAVRFWGDAPVDGKVTEPGGQANKPYMFGASTSSQGSKGLIWNYSLRLQSSNSFCVARQKQDELKGKLYDASFYADLHNGKGYQKAATISYQWQPWTIDNNGKWVRSLDAYGAGVPQLTFADPLGGKVSVQASKAAHWTPRIMTWSSPYNVNPANLSQDNNVLGGLLREYFATAITQDPQIKYLIVLNTRNDWTAGSGDWGAGVNWSNGAAPGDYNNVYLEQSDGVNRTVTYHNPAAAAPPLSMLRLDATGAGSLTLQVDSGGPGGELKAEMAIVGAAGKGAVRQTAGAVTLSDRLILGYEEAANGVYTLQGGTLTTPNVLVGLYGAGAFTQSGGAAIVSDALTIGSGGTYTHNGGDLRVKHLINLGTFNGPGPNATLTYEKLDLQGGNFVGDLENKTLLTGFGPLTGNVINSGVASPGNSPGILNIIGSYTQTATGTYLAEIASATEYDKINVTGAPGAASLNGGLAPVLLRGYRPRGNQVFPGIITTTGGVTGAFSRIAHQQISPTLFWQARYNPASVDLWVQRRYTNPGLGLNSNQAAVGAMLNGVSGVTSGDLDTVLNTIDYLPDSAGVRQAFKQISPEKAGALTTLAFTGVSFQMRHLAQRVSDLRFGSRAAGVLDGLPGSFNFNYSRGEGLRLAYNSASLAGLITAKPAAAPGSRWGLYLDPALILGSQQSSINQTGFNFTLAGFTAGADYRVRDDFLMGLATGYSHTGAGFHGSGGGVQTNTWPLTAYAAYLPQSFYAYGSLGYALNLFDLERGLRFGDLSRTASSSTAGQQLNAYGEAGYDLKANPLVLTPVVSLAYSGLWVDGFTERGAGALNLKVASQDATSLQTGVGAKMAAPLKRGSVRVVPQAYATFQHEFAHDRRGLNASLSQGGGTFNFQTDAAKKNYASVGANITVLTEKNFRVHLNYNAEVGRSNSTAHYLNAGVRWEF